MGIMPNGYALCPMSKPRPTLRYVARSLDLSTMQWFTPDIPHVDYKAPAFDFGGCVHGPGRVVLVAAVSDGQPADTLMWMPGKNSPWW